MKRFYFVLLSVFLLCAKAQVNTFSFNINGSPPPAGFIQALTIAGQKWSNYLQINIPIKVNIFTVNSNLYPFSAITLANGRQNFSNTPVPNILYTTALSNQIAGSETNVGEFDMDIYFNLATNYYYGTGNPSGSQIDFISTAMHEIGHGLGFYSDAYVDGGGKGSFGNIPPSALFPLTTSFPWPGQGGVPGIYDKFIVKASNSSLVGIAPDGSNALGDSIKNNPHYFSGPLFANASHSNTPIRLSGGAGTFTLGVDLLHIHDSYANTIMSYYWGAGDTVRTPAPWELGILKEIGWNLITVGMKENNNYAIASAYPNPASDNICVRAKNISEVNITNVQGQVLSSKINAVKEEEIIIDTKNLNEGIYFLSIKFSNSNQRVTKKVMIRH